MKSHLKLEAGISRGQRVFSGLCVLVGITAFWTDSMPASMFVFCGFLLFAWSLMLGVFGAVRNPVAHAPRTEWAMPEQDAVDVFSLVSYLHRKLDSASIVCDGEV